MKIDDIVLPVHWKVAELLTNLWMIFGLTWELIEVLNLKAVSQFKKDFKKYRHNEDVLDEFEEIVDLLRKEKQLPQKYLDLRWFPLSRPKITKVKLITPSF